MKADLIEYHSNGCIKHKISYYDNGSKNTEVFYDENGKYHRENGLPDSQYWNENERLGRRTYCVHDRYHNICGPANIFFQKNGKIYRKYYYVKKCCIPYTKLKWINQIKNI